MRVLTYLPVNVDRDGTIVIQDNLGVADRIRVSLASSILGKRLWQYLLCSIRAAKYHGTIEKEWP